MTIENGSVYVVSTPIGNLKDITYRAIEVLNSVELIICESIYQTKILLNYYKIQKPLKQIFKDESENPYSNLFSILKKGGSLAIVSDAGTPGISDPGSHIIRSLREKSVQIIPVPGASALITLLSVSGYKSNPFIFLGFLPEKSSKKVVLLEKFKNLEYGLLIFYESVHRINKSLEFVREVFPESEILIGRELTKMHEEFIFLNPNEEEKKVCLPTNWKGEFTVIVKIEKKIKGKY